MTKSLPAWVVLALLLGGCGEPEEQPGTTWSNGAGQFFDSYCVRCHDAGHSGGDYTQYDDVFEDRAVMRCGLAATELDGCEPPMPDPKTFPTGPRPPEAEVAELIDWLEAGLPE